LRRLVAARSLRARRQPHGSRAGTRDMNSVTMVRVTRITAPTSAVTTDHDVECETDRQIERQPRQIEERAGPMFERNERNIVQIT